MRPSVLAGVGLPGATVFGVMAWVLKVCHEAPGHVGHPSQLLCGADEYWNGEYPEGEQK